MVSMSGAPRFERLVNEMFDNNEETIRYVQAVLGHCLSGSVKEHKFFIFYDESGKDDVCGLLEAFAKVVGDTESGYALVLRDPDDLNDDNEMLHGKRAIILPYPENPSAWFNKPIVRKIIMGAGGYTAKLLFYTNKKPERPDNNLADRAVVIPYKSENITIGGE